MEQLGGDPADTRWAGVEPPAVEAGLLEFAGPVVLSRGPYVVGEKVTARFVLRNAGGAAGEVEDVRGCRALPSCAAGSWPSCTSRSGPEASQGVASGPRTSASSWTMRGARTRPGSLLGL